MLFQILWTIFSLVIVISIAYFILLLLKKKGMVRTDSKYIKVVDVLQIGQDKQLMVVEVEEKRMLIGVTNSSVNLIQDLGKAKDVNSTGDQDE
ncbi:flagellar biosynthetic protein FliO [Caldanaerobius polysaccharolyticus]|uniref:flagellar biosynthetic protein FliO n=1 Tax=Caldanaerobius polysaccharolyticus TaxID=44256 RepID=UPI00047D86E5|nr:flagellar biosynthetic protein FliO [Caldanaerobius polysaccharolyticus]